MELLPLRCWLGPQQVFLLLLFFGVGNISAIDYPDCVKLSSPYPRDKPHCEDQDHEAFVGKRTVYWESDHGNNYQAMCCKPGSELEKSILASASPTCQTTQCVAKPGGGGGVCLQRELTDGTYLNYEEIIRDSCVDAQGAPGWVAQCCLKNSTEGLLLSMMGAEVGEFPHQVGVVHKRTDGLLSSCGGTIYNRNHVLTAAHCVIDRNTGRPYPASWFTVQVGTTIGGHAGFDSKGSKFQVAEVIHHKEYTGLEGKSGFPSGDILNDIALLKIKGSFSFSDRVKSLEVAPERFVPETYAPNAVLLGWGTTDTLQVSQHLQKVNARLRSDEECFGFDEATWERGPWASKKPNQSQLLCAGGIYKQEFSPTAGGGDSGGGAVCRGPDGSAVLCGIASFVRDDQKCGTYGTAEWCVPTVYVEVEYFRRNWDLLKAAGPQDPNTFFRYKLYGDEDIPTGKYAHQVHITSDTGKSCGGTLIAKNLVLTAASCVSQVDGGGNPTGSNHAGLRVFHGVRDLADSASRGAKELQVADVRYHYDFKRIGPQVTREGQYNQKKKYYRVKMTDNYHQHDLALIKLAEDAPIDDTQVAQLPAQGSTPAGPATELALPRDLKYGGRMRSREFKFVPKDNCQQRLDRLSRIGVNSGQLDDDVVCAVERYSGGSTCDRELGGGLLCKGPRGGEDNVLCGVQVFRLCEFSIPNGFIDVAKNLWFIDGAKKSFGVK